MSDTEQTELTRLTALLHHGLASAKHRPSLQRTMAEATRNDEAIRAQARVVLARFFAELQDRPMELIHPIYERIDGFRIDLVSTLEVDGAGERAFRISGPPDVMDGVIAELEADAVNFRRLGKGTPNQVG